MSGDLQARKRNKDKKKRKGKERKKTYRKIFIFETLNRTRKCFFIVVSINIIVIAKNNFCSMLFD